MDSGVGFNEEGIKKENVGSGRDIGWALVWLLRSTVISLAVRGGRTASGSGHNDDMG